MKVVLEAEQAKLAALKCRFGCDDAVVGIFHAPEGCHCWRDPVQALCAQHAIKMESTGPITCVVDFRVRAWLGDGQQTPTVPVPVAGLRFTPTPPEAETG